MGGVIEQECQREERWTSAGLVDPIKILGEERLMAFIHDEPGWRSPRRALFDAHIAEHGELPAELPNEWSP